MKRPLTILLLMALTVAVVAFDSAVVLGVIAKSRGVEAAAVPTPSLIESVASDADHADGVRVPVALDAFPAMEVFLKPAFRRGMQITGRGPAEVVYRGDVPGLQYHVAYALEDVEGRRYLTVTTVVHYRHPLARLYGGAVLLGRWGVVPFALSRLAG